MAECRSCGAPIFWVTTAKGKAMPLDRDPTEDGNIIVRTIDGLDRCTVLANPDQARELLERADIPADRFTSHFATCPNAAEHRNG